MSIFPSGDSLIREIQSWGGQDWRLAIAHRLRVEVKDEPHRAASMEDVAGPDGLVPRYPSTTPPAVPTNSRTCSVRGTCAQVARLQDVLLNQIIRQGRGKVFTPKDFLELGSRDAVDQALSRLVKDGSIQRLGRGLYYYPPDLSTAWNPSLPGSRRDRRRSGASNWKQHCSIRRDGSESAWALHSSTSQAGLPHRWTQQAGSRGKHEFFVKHVSPKELPIGSRTSATVLQALRYLERDGVDDKVVAKIRKDLSTKHRSQLLPETRYTTDWMAEVVPRIARETTRSVCFKASC